MWWGFLSRDRRANEDYGVQSGYGKFQISSVSLPLNTEDVDLFPGMSALPSTREGWTAMTHHLVYVHIFQATQKLISVTNSSSPPVEETRLRMIDEVKVHLHKCVRECNPVIPRQRLAIVTARFLLQKLNFLSRIQWQLIRCPGSNEVFDDEDNLREAMEVLEASQTMMQDEMFPSYITTSRAYPQYHITLYILWYLCAHPLVSDYEQAWKLVNKMLLEERDFAVEGVDAKLPILEAIATKAKAVRDCAVNMPSLAVTESVVENSIHLEGQETHTNDHFWEFPLAIFTQGADVGVETLQQSITNFDWMTYSSNDSLAFAD